MMNERIAKLKKELLGVKPGLSAERVLLATEAYKKYAGEPIYLFRAHVLEYVLDRKAVVIRDGELLAGSLSEKLRSAAIFPEYNSTRMWLRDELPNMSKRKSDPMDISPEDVEKVLECFDYWDGKSTEDLAMAAFPEYYKDCEAAGVFKSGGKGLCSSAVTPNYLKLFKEGFGGMISRCQANIDKALEEGMTLDKQKKVQYWQAVMIVLKAVIRYSHRCADEAQRQAETCADEKRRGELLELARICRKVPEYSPETFYEAIQFQWMTQVICNVEASSYSTSLGRMDQNYIEYYRKDLEAGRIDRDRAIELISCLFIKSTTVFYMNDEYYSQADAGYPTWQILSIGGVDPEGRDACNELTDIILDVANDLRIAQPVALRVTPDTPEEIWHKAIWMNQQGMGNPAFYNDVTAQKMVIEQGATVEEARDWVITGCVEPKPGTGIADGSATGGNINFPKILEVTLHNGKDPLTGKQLGPKTGEPSSWKCIEDVMEAYEKQCDYFWDLHMRAYRITNSIQATYLPTIYQSSLIGGCIENGESLQEGGCYKPFTNVFITAPSTLADSMMAIKYAVFVDKKMTMDELIALCDSNFEGVEGERMRQYLVNRPPKFGNDNSEADSYINQFLEGFWKRGSLKPDGRHNNGRFALGNQSQTHNVPLGRCVGATPDGRKAFAPLSDNASPTMGRDVSGPTAAANSVAHLPNEHFHGGCLYNTRFDPHGVAGEDGIKIMEGVVKGFCKQGGYHLQINVVDDATLRKAQETPEDYRDLVVRVAGYLAYFTELDREVQDVIISRTAHLA